MDEKVKAELDNIVSVLADTGMVSKIILFGSFARGEEMPDSDFDLCVLTQITDKCPRAISGTLRMKLWDFERPMDLFTFNQEEFFHHAKRPTSFHHHIVETGKILYEQK